MDGDTERSLFMRHQFQHCNLTRVPAVKGTDLDLLLRRMEDGSFPDVPKLKRRTYFETYARFQALPGQLGNFIAHLDAIKLGYDRGDDYIVTMEDDVGLQLAPFWATTIDQYIRHANEQFPNWQFLRLQWNDYKHHLRNIKRKWQRDLRRVDTDTHAHWGAIDGATTRLPLMRSWNRGWGNVAALWNRAGMERLLEIHLAGTDGDGLGVWRCNPELACLADLTFWPEGGDDGTLIATPPLITYRLGEVQTPEIRFGQIKSNHQGLHLQSVFSALQWALEFQEYYTPGGGLNIPFNAKLNITMEQEGAD